ncbi:MAG: site-2 protease family protein, partial [Planctomycetota bacterium]
LLTPLAYHFSEEMGGLLELGVGLNILLGLFNLMPIPPFDGGRILVALVREVRQLFDSPGGQNIFLIAFMLLFVTDAFAYLRSFAFGVAWLLVDVSGVLWSPILG